MAFDLWGTSFTEEENSPFIQPEWPYDFYFGYGIDMIEENALNEKSCIQVLRILIAKADTEIDELEKDLVLLQSELVWAEHEEWHDICCSALRAKINCLDISIRKLRNKDENDIEVYLLMHTEPVEKLHEIMKALLKSFYNEKHEQNEQSQDVVPDSRSGSLEQSAALHKNQKLNSSDSCFIAKEENNGPNVTPKENFTSSNPSMELEVKKANSSETLANADVKDLMPHFLLPAAGQFDEKSIITLLDLETTKKLKESGRALKDKNVVQHFSLKSAQKRKNNLYRTKDAAAQCVNDSDLDASKHSAGRLNKKKKTSSSSLKIVSEEATMHTSISAADMLILDSSSNSTGMTGDLTKKVKEEQTADIIANDLGLIAHKQMIGDSSEMKTLGKHDVKINGCEVQGQDTSNFSNSCLNPEHEGNIQNADKVESLKFDMDQKLCDFAVKSARKQRTKESKVASMDKNQHSNSLLKGEEKRNDTLQDVTPKEASPSDNEHSALTSLVEPQDENGEDKTIQLMEEKSQMEEVPMSEVVSSDGKLVTNLYMRLQRGKVKTVKPNMESTAADAEESGLNSMENLSNSSPFPKGKRTWKNTNNCSLNYSLTGKIIKKTVQHSQCEAEGTSLMLDASQNTMPLPQKKCKKLSSVPIVVEFRASSVQMNISKLHGDLNKSNIVKTEFAESGALVDDLGAKGVVPWPLDASSLMKMKLRDLRAIAKSQKLKKYSTMKKEDLVKRLENGLSC
ncbi:hypothetical protein ERO13_A01G130811v2 [Gossypium hirsutum]|uniref:Rho termination factor-like N-terminal domain-containing protein n=1 Tax=Gossypium barbadense TaxID=3634 RepID=A0A5J5WYK5_GOSBA|nr:hypothetical protein ES319_A01G134700v1 [Gossypium barbadense]KAB2096895.1 hypothetical protein ES319_A01G134700v1 [Gossypium barbadense]KAG4214609.1 hypothetical protein ERO13_A01G130811v2 [Gossypium hirsutum]